MKKLSIIAICIIASVLVACGGGKSGSSGNGSGEKYDLYYKLEPGKTYSQKIMANVESTTSVMGQSVDMTMTMAFDIDFTVADTTDGIITGDNSITHFAIGIKMPMMGMDMSYSSDDELSADPVSRIFKAMVGKPFTMNINKYGEVISMSGLEEMVDEVCNSMDLSPSELTQARAILEESFSEEKMMEQLQNMAIYPSHPVALGDSWTMDVKNAKMDMENTYTLEKVTDTEIVLEVESKVNSAAVDGFTGTIGGIQNGTTIVHRSSGWIKKAEINQDISGSGKMQGMDAKMQIKSNITISE